MQFHLNCHKATMHKFWGLATGQNKKVKIFNHNTYALKQVLYSAVILCLKNF